MRFGDSFPAVNPSGSDTVIDMISLPIALNVHLHTLQKYCNTVFCSLTMRIMDYEVNEQSFIR
jgi:hypothetical protein